MYPCRVLFICTGNSARSILCEATLNHLSQGRFEACSAGSHPVGRVHPSALAQLARADIAIDGLASKSWDRFAQSGAPSLDIVITVCDNAAHETCPVFPGDFVRSHWGLLDPAVAKSAEALSEAFRDIHQGITQRLTALLLLPVETMSRDDLRRALDQLSTTSIDARVTA